MFMLSFLYPYARRQQTTVFPRSEFDEQLMHSCRGAMILDFFLD